MPEYSGGFGKTGFVFAVLFRVFERVQLNKRIEKDWPLGHWLGSQDLPCIQRQFLGVQLMASMIALCVFPLWILWQATLTVEMALVFFWLMGPLAAAAVLIQSRSFLAAFFISSLSFAGLISTLCMLTGGLKSFALIWLLAVPFEAVLSRDKRILSAAVLIVCVCLALLSQSPLFNTLSAYPALTAADPLGFVFGPLALTLYIAGLAMKMNATNVGVQNRLNSSEERYRLLAENSKDLILEYDIEGKIVLASPAAKSLLGVDASKLEGNDFLEYIHIADRPSYMQGYSDVAKQGMPRNLQCRMKVNLAKNKRCSKKQDKGIAVDHDYAWVEIRSRPLWNHKQDITGVISTIVDITEQHAREEELQAMHREIKELNDAKGRFIANMSHELRTPLNAIIGFSDILSQELFGKLQNKKQKEYVELINESGNHLLQVVTEILDMSKIDSGTFDIVPEPFDVKSLVETCTNILSQQAEVRGIELQNIVPDDLPEAVADPRACRQILINLISNALKFSNEDGRVVVGVRLEGSKLAYFIRDNGIGMSKEDLERIGQPFFQADSAHDRRYEGTGLGVCVVKGLTELHEGEVRFESKPGKGTTVTVYMPLECDVDQTTVHDFNADLKNKNASNQYMGKDNGPLERIA